MIPKLSSLIDQGLQMSPNPLSPSSPQLGPFPPASLPGQTTITGDDRLWGMLAHLLALVSYLLAGLSFVGPLLVYIFKRDKSAFIAYHAREALNFNISLAVYMVITVLLTYLITQLLAVLILAIPIFGCAMAIIAGLKANKGELYHYPLCIRFIK